MALRPPALGPVPSWPCGPQPVPVLDWEVSYPRIRRGSSYQLCALSCFCCAGYRYRIWSVFYRQRFVSCKEFWHTREHSQTAVGSCDSSRPARTRANLRRPNSVPRSAEKSYCELGPTVSTVPASGVPLECESDRFVIGGGTCRARHGINTTKRTLIGIQFII